MEKLSEQQPGRNEGGSETTKQCLNCGASIDTEKVYWRKFCSDKCRMAFNTLARKEGRKYLENKVKQEFLREQGV